MIDEKCIFCKIVGGTIPCHKVYETDLILAFLDINPATIGHTIVIPKDHHETLLDIPEDLVGTLFKSVKEVSKLLKEKLGADGFNILQNNYEAAGQVVPHAHIHITPVKQGDRAYNLNHLDKKLTPEDFEKLLEKLK